MEQPPPHVLLVDDDPLILRTLKEALSGEPYLVSIAPSGEEALRTLTSRAFSLVLTDARLEGMSGEELAASIERLFPATEVVLMTGAPGPPPGGGRWRVLEKPFRPSVLRNLIREILSLKGNPGGA